MKNVIFGLTIILCMSVTHAAETGLLYKLDTVAEHGDSHEAGQQAKYRILNMMIDCEFDEACELQMIPKLQALNKQTPNIVYKGFLNYLQWEKSDLESNAKNCKSEQKKQARKVYAACYKKWAEQEIAHPPQAPLDIEKSIHSREMCIEKNIKSLADKGNIFAQTELMNVAVKDNDDESVRKWSAKIESKKGTADFNVLMKCPELP